MESHSGTCHPTQVNTYRLNSSQTGWYSGIQLTYTGRMEGWVDLLVTCYIRKWFTRPQTVTHPSTNRAQCRLTTLIEANALATRLRRHGAYTATENSPFLLTVITASRLLGLSTELHTVYTLLS